MSFTQQQVNAYNARLAVKNRPIASSPVEIESDLHEQIFTECRRRGWIAFHGMMSERTHRTAGEPDFTILGDRGRIFLIECKSRTGKLSREQNGMIAHARMLGHLIHVVTSCAEFLEVVK